MTELRQVTLTDQELGIALRVAGVVPQANSPLGQVRPNGSANPAVLAAHGMLDMQGSVTPEWRLALAALSAPPAYVWAYSHPISQEVARMFVPAGLGFVAHASAQGTHMLAMPILPDELVEEFMGTLNANTLPVAQSVAETLWPDELVTLVAITDAYREEAIRSMLERRQPQFANTSLQQLDYQVRWAAARDDRRWLSRILGAHAPDVYSLRCECLSPGLNGLARREWLSVQAETVRLSDVLQRLCALLSNISPYLVLATRDRGAQRRVLMIRSLAAVAALEFLTSDKGDPMLA